ncbi:prolipoprotein diacylglyceryl transferase [uncultured Victivallis sp.]|uniref:prolipoprotein diacylglyceryl transferase n=1 Tax=uncultured Victivallis sp. TaxID=354118 RepID=UPI0025D6CD6D|nr:prolipoprotein diacylglyceryl transferase [uncultured Victivallis sp.]
MHPVLFQIGGFSLRSYGLMAAIGFLLAAWLIGRTRKYAAMSADQASASLFVAMIAGIVGARIFYVVQFFHQYRDHLWRIIRIDQGGLVFYGGFLLAIASLWVFARRQKLDIVRILDAYTPAIALAHACGRIGCFLNGCCYGKPTELFWGVRYPAGSEAALRYPGAALHPVQLYEAGGQFLLMFFYLYLLRRAPRGVAMSCYLIFYGTFRFLNELLRGDNPKVFELFTPAQLIGLAVIPTGVLLLVYFLRHGHKKA